MKLKLVREYDPEVTEGILYDATGKKLCYTLELPDKDNEPNISCIPEGAYKYRKIYSSKFGRQVFRLDGVPGRSLIDIHAGNCVRDIEGCILVGAKRGVLNWHQLGYIYPAVLSSAPTLDKLMPLLGYDGTIEITSEK